MVDPGAAGWQHRCMLGLARARIGGALLVVSLSGCATARLDGTTRSGVKIWRIAKCSSEKSCHEAALEKCDGGYDRLDDEPLRFTCENDAGELASTSKRMAADDLLREVFANEIGALEKYDGKIVNVVGTVEATGLKTVKKTAIETESQSNVVCMFSTANRAAAASVQKGDRQTLQGEVYRVKRERGAQLGLADGGRLFGNGDQVELRSASALS